MFNNDRVEFDKQLATMMGGFPGYFLTPERAESYWRGMQKMNIGAFVRVVDHVLSPEGPEKIPSVHALWDIQRAQRNTNSPKQQPSEVDTRDKWNRFADHLFFNYLMRKGGCDSKCITTLVAIKNTIAANYRDIGSEEHVTPEEFRDVLIERLDKAFIALPGKSAGNLLQPSTRKPQQEHAEAV